MNKILEAILWVVGWGAMLWFFWFLLDFDLLVH